MELMKFYADWCAPCKAVSTLLQQEDRLKNIKLIEVDIDEYLSAVTEFRVKSIPTLILFDENGKELRRLSGNITPTNLDNFLNP